MAISMILPRPKRLLPTVRHYRSTPAQFAVSTVNNIIEPYHYNAGNLAWTWRIDTAGKKLTTEAHLISYRNLSDALMSSVATDGATGLVISSNTHAFASARLYNHPFSKVGPGMAA